MKEEIKKKNKKIKLTNDLPDLEKELTELKNQLARALADYDNLRKRVDLEREEFTKFSNLRIVAKLLNVYDMFEEAQKHLKDSGVAIAIREFESILADEGIEKIPVEKNQNFDENLHEAIEMVGGEKKGKISEVILTGWRFGDGKIIRHAKVRVEGGK